MADTRFGPQLMRRFSQFARHSDEPEQLTRVYLSPAHKRACEELEGWLQQAGMTTRCDALATLIGRYEGTELAAPALLIGSHIDTVRNAGKFDGTLGVLAALAAVEELHRLNERFAFAIEIVAFGDEEGVRFPITLSGSRALAGTLGRHAFNVKDAAGISLGDALREFGCDPEQLLEARRSPVDTVAFIEAHIEQGPVLEQNDQPLGVVTAISAAKRFSVTVTGSSGHAGTVPMDMRSDSLAASAEMVLEIEALAKRADQVVATVGFIEAKPGSVNVIPGTTSFTIDLRSATNSECKEQADRIEEKLTEIARRRGVSVSVQPTHAMEAVECALNVRNELSRAIETLGYQPIALPSGAGHDAMAMATLCDTGMLFVRCKGGLSHHPGESIAEADADACVRALLAFIRSFEPARTDI
ncbi:MAG: allantoate amidohydrolase [Hyphomicrobiaceae bacterium]